MDCFKIKSGTSLVRIFNAAPQLPQVDIYINENIVFTNLQFKQFSSYITLGTGDYRIDVFIAGEIDRPIISGSISLEEGQIFTISAIGNLNDLELLVINDRTDKKTIPGKSAFRVVHLSPSEPTVDVIVNNKNLVEDLNYKQNTSYVDANPGQYKFDVVLSSNNEGILSFGTVLKGDRIYTIYIVGDEPNISAVKSVDGNTYLCK